MQFPVFGRIDLPHSSFAEEVQYAKTAANQLAFAKHVGVSGILHETGGQDLAVHHSVRTIVSFEQVEHLPLERIVATTGAAHKRELRLTFVVNRLTEDLADARPTI